jgi:hypothetical protein
MQRLDATTALSAHWKRRGCGPPLRLGRFCPVRCISGAGVVTSPGWTETWRGVGSFGSSNAD